MSNRPVNYYVENGIAVISLNNHPVNTLGLPVRNCLKQLFDQALEDPGVEGIVLASSLKVFSAGADVSEFDTSDALAGSNLPGFCTELDVADKLIVAALEGAALGGGLELAMAADYRFAHPDARLSLPEIRLGIIPGAGGTQRLSRLAGMERAAEMIMTGRPVRAGELEGGLVDRLYRGEGSFLGAAVAYARELLDSAAPLRDCTEITVDPAELSPDFFDRLHAHYVGGKTGGVRNFESAIVALKAACEGTLPQGLEVERNMFLGCMGTSEARAAQHLFFAERAALKVPGVSRDTRPRAIERVAVVGAGTMGGGIAVNFANADIPVILLEQGSDQLEVGLQKIREHYEHACRKGRISPEQLAQRLALFQGSLDYEDLTTADLVIEAVFESMDVKRQVFRELDRVCKPDAILATNTSTLDVNAIAAETRRPANVLGMHFFSPASVMQLLEIVRGDSTSPEVLSTVIKLAQRINKVPVVVGVCYGFVGNRMIAPYSREAFRMVLEGVAPEQVDAALTRFGMAMGPLAMADMAGIDVGCMAAEANRADWAGDRSYQALQFRLREMGHLGQKTGRGVYAYAGRSREGCPETVDLAGAIARELEIPQRRITDREIVERCLYSLINEGAHILQEGIASRSSDIDLIYARGYGFPDWRGGPMAYADEVGLHNLLDSIYGYQDGLGDYGVRWFQPAPLLEELVATGQKIGDYAGVNGKNGARLDSLQSR